MPTASRSRNRPAASASAWQDEAHVEANRVQYRQKFALFLRELGHLLPFQKPDAGFYFWLAVEDDEAFAQRLYQQANVTVLPGRYLSRHAHGLNPGVNHVRMALVAEAYGELAVDERHRHRYEVNNAYREPLAEAGLVFSGTSPDGHLVEYVELPADVHPYFVATQAHPEFRSRPTRPHPLFSGLVRAALARQSDG